MRLLIILIVASVVVASCSIQKRTFRSGYYISWNKPIKQKTDQKENKDPETEQKELLAETKNDTISEITIKPNEDLAVLESQDTLQEVKQEGATDSLVVNQRIIDSETALAEPRSETGNQIKKQKHPAEEWESSEREPNLFAINSLVFAIGYVILSFITIYTGLFVLAIISFLLALFLAIVAIIKWKRHKGDFWGTFFAVMALGLLVLGTLILLLFIVAGSL